MLPSECGPREQRCNRGSSPLGQCLFSFFENASESLASPVNAG